MKFYFFYSIFLSVVFLVSCSNNSEPSVKNEKNSKIGRLSTAPQTSYDSRIFGHNYQLATQNNSSFKLMGFEEHQTTNGFLFYPHEDNPIFLNKAVRSK
jgi:hypothetical protein